MIPPDEPVLDFMQMVEAYLVNGYVVNHPEFFIAARPVPREAPVAEIYWPAIPFELKECNAWFVAMFAGDPRMIWTVLPFELQYCGYQRVPLEPIRWFNLNRYRRTMSPGKPDIKPPEPTPPPPTTTGRDRTEAKRQAQRARSQRRGYSSTLLSNQTGGQMQPRSGQGNTLLS